MLLVNASTPPSSEQDKNNQNNSLIVLYCATSKSGTFDADEKIAQFITRKKTPTSAKIDFFKLVFPNRALFSKKRTAATPIIIDWIKSNQSDPAAIEAIKFLSTKGYVDDENDFSSLVTILSSSTNSGLVDKIEKLLGTKLQSSEKKRPLSLSILDKYKSTESKTGKQALLDLLIYSGSTEIIQDITKTLKTPAASKLLSQLNNWPNLYIIETLFEQMKNYPPKGKTASMRNKYSETIAKILANENTQTDPDLEKYTRMLIETANTNYEISSSMSALVTIQKPWTLKLMQELLKKTKDPKLKQNIQEAIKQASNAAVTKK